MIWLKGGWIKMPEDIITLWAHQVSGDFPNGRSPKDLYAFVGKGKNLQKDLGALIDYCVNVGGQWSIAKVECKENDVTEVSELRNGWMRALFPIYSDEGFMPLEEAEKKYQDYIKYA